MATVDKIIVKIDGALGQVISRVDEPATHYRYVISIDDIELRFSDPTMLVRLGGILAGLAERARVS